MHGAFQQFRLFDASWSGLQSFYTWTGLGGDDLWNNGNNWSTGTIPVSISDIIINSGTPKLNIDYEVGGTLTIGSTGTLTIDPGKTLSIASTGAVDFGGKSPGVGCTSARFA